jgi:transcriptional regulator with XRE-family HTH domain
MKDMASNATIRTTKGSPVYPQVTRSLEKLGRDISLARRRRRIAAEDFAQQMGVSRMTLHRLENGDPGISLNTLTMALFVLGRINAVADLADPAKDDIGVMITRQEAPRRIPRPHANASRLAAQKTDDPTSEPEPDANGYVGF